jgi:hypothetical protein
MSSSHTAFEGEDGAAIASSALPSQPLPSDASSTQALATILLEIEASDYLQKFIDDQQDDDCIPSYRHPDRIATSYGLPPSLASAFVEKCRARASAQRCALQHAWSFFYKPSQTSHVSGSAAPGRSLSELSCDKIAYLVGAALNIVHRSLANMIPPPG